MRTNYRHITLLLVSFFVLKCSSSNDKDLSMELLLGLHETRKYSPPRITQHQAGSYTICPSPGKPTLTTNTASRSLQPQFTEANLQADGIQLTAPIGPVQLLETPEPFSAEGSPQKFLFSTNSTHLKSSKPVAKKWLSHFFGKGHSGLLVTIDKSRPVFKRKKATQEVVHICRFGATGTVFKELFVDNFEEMPLEENDLTFME